MNLRKERRGDFLISFTFIIGVEDIHMNYGGRRALRPLKNRTDQFTHDRRVMVKYMLALQRVNEHRPLHALVPQALNSNRAQRIVESCGEVMRTIAGRSAEK